MVTSNRSIGAVDANPPLLLMSEALGLRSNWVGKAENDVPLNSSIAVPVLSKVSIILRSSAFFAHGVPNLRSEISALLWSHWNGLLRRTRATL